MSEFGQGRQVKRLRIYIGEADRWRGKPLYAALLEILRLNGIAGATVIRGIAGFGARSRIHTATILRLSEDLPLIIDVVDTEESIHKALEAIFPMVREGLITVEDVKIIQYTHRYLNPLPADRPVASVMTRDVIAITPETSVASGWEKMLEHNVKVLPVIDAERKVVGILTDEDLLERAGLNQRLAIATRASPDIVNEEIKSLRQLPLTVRDVMSSPVITIRENESLGVAAALMLKKGVKRLPVVDNNERLIGILSRLDVIRQVAAQPLEVPLPLQGSGAYQKVGDIMIEQVPIVNRDDPLQRLVEAFQVTNSHRLIVVDEQGKAVGLISDSDLVSRIQSDQQRSILNALRQLGKPPAIKVSAYDLMSPGPLTVSSNISIVQAIQMMMAEGRKWLVVVDEAGKPIGLVDRPILLRAITMAYGA
ncbi:MAG: CBS domain-containing protein [Anaerolineae bacterium]|nr:CBS domain-containing protein [Anaerolineae bacterium]